MLENISCKKSKDIDADIMNKINNKYYFLKKKDVNGNLFRLSGGSWGQNYKNNKLFIGHFIVYLQNFDIDEVNTYIDSNNDNDIMKINLCQFFKKRNYQLKLFTNTFLYYNCFILLNNDYEFIKISHCFNLYNKEDTGINFSLGLSCKEDNVIISMGESDCNSAVIKLSKSNMNFLLNNDDNIKFLSYDVNLNDGIKKYKSLRKTLKRSFKKNKFKV